MSKDGYTINEPPVGNVRPAIPPKAPPAAAPSSDLPLLPSERRELNERIKEANQRFGLAYSQACSKFTSIINTDSTLTDAQKQNILDQLWK